MIDYQADYHWELLDGTPVLFVTVTGHLLSNPRAIPAIIDRAHHLSNAHHEFDQVWIVYDFTRTEGRLPLQALMVDTELCSKICRISVIGLHSRADEMSILIMAAAKQASYPVDFFTTEQSARVNLAGQGRSTPPAN